LHLVCIYDYITVLQFCVGFLLELPSNFCGDFLLESSKGPTKAKSAPHFRWKCGALHDFIETCRSQLDLAEAEICKVVHALGALGCYGCCALGVAGGVSHLSRRGFRDVAGIARAPFLASHSNCNAVYRHPRSLTDRQIDCIITRGGLIGINLYRAFLGRPGSAGFAAAHRHIRHVLERGGEHVLALGSDFDGCELEPCFAGVEKLEAFQDYLLANGMPQEQADALFYKNAEKFFQTLLQPQTDMLK